MKRSTWIILGAGLVILVCLALYVLYMVNKPPSDTAKEKTSFSVDAKDLINAFNTQEAEATEKYVDQILEITGTLSGWAEDPDGNFTLFLEDELFGVSCLMESEYNESISARLGNELVKGSKLRIKGRCDGMLTDVKLSKSILIE